MNDIATAFDVEASAPVDKIAAIREKIAAMLSLESLVSNLEEDLKAAKSSLHEMRTKTLPELMAGAQTFSMGYDNGNERWKIEIKDFVQGSLPKEPEAREKAIGLLIGYDAGGLLKTEVSCSFGKGEHEKAVGIYATLKEQGVPATLETGIHAQTLMAFARERLEGGLPIDCEALGLFAGKIAKATMEKEKKPKKGKSQ